MRKLVLAVAMSGLVGCARDGLQPNEGGSRPFDDGGLAATGGEACQINPNCGSGVDGSITGTTQTLSFTPDPSPGAAGIWIGALATDCYKNYGSALADYDNDLLADECEYRLAHEFTPQLMMNPNDGCLQGEPYWAARYFDDGWGLGWGQFVRIAYLLSYYKDCGTNAHLGDSEMIVIRVAHNGVTKHWEVVNVFTSAHFMTGGDHSAITRWQDFYYPSGKSQTYPRIWVSKGKHANYKSQSVCNGAVAGTETCTGNVSYGRIKIYKSHNLGGYNRNLLNCVASQNKLYYQNGRLECYFSTTARFKGWQTVGSGDATGYYPILNSYGYECYVYSSDFGSCYWGPYGTRY